jgi:ABC-type nitrate/sulfonate/bicarbonate transport system permease component
VGILTVVGEMIASQEGLGRVILMAARTFHSRELFVGMGLLGVIGFECLPATVRKRAFPAPLMRARVVTNILLGMDEK